MSTKVQAPQPSSEEKALQAANLQELGAERARRTALEPFDLAARGLVKDASGNLRQMTTEERVARLTPLEQIQRENALFSAERFGKLQRGETDAVSPLFTQQRGEQRGQLSTGLAQRLGSRFAGTTSGAQSLGRFDLNTELLKDEARRQALGQASGIALNQLGGQTGLQQQGVGFAQFNPQLGLLQAGNQALQPFQFNRNMQFEANKANAANKAQLLSDIGSVAGLAATGGLSAGGFFNKTPEL